MSEVNVEAAIQLIKEYDGPIINKWELIEIFNALRQPVEQKNCTCEVDGICPLHGVVEQKRCEHEWVAVRSPDMQIIRNDCWKCGQSKTKQENLSLAEKFERKKKEWYWETGKMPELAEIAEKHYAPLLAKVKEEGRKEALEAVRTELLNVWKDI